RSPRRPRPSQRRCSTTGSCYSRVAVQRGLSMAKRRTWKRGKQRYLVVRGKGNDVYITVAPAAISDARLASLVDDYSKNRRSVYESSRALIVDADSKPVMLVGQSLGPPKK